MCNLGFGVCGLAAIDLLFDIAVDTERPNPFDITGPRTETEPVENVKDLLIFAQSVFFAGAACQRPVCTDRK